MDGGKLKVDNTYYEGYEGEKEIVITFLETEYHFWEGYFEDIFGAPVLSDTGWHGLTKDYNELDNAFDDETIECAVPAEEYLDDLRLYRNRSFEYEETADVLQTLVHIFEKAEKMKDYILVRVN